MIMSTTQMIEEYNSKLDLFKGFELATTSLIKQILLERHIRVHSISSRVKELNSLADKISRHDPKYSSLDEITDIIGIRIITYFEDEVDIVANVIHDEFNIDNDNSIDKRTLLDPDRFGYLSLHYVVQLNSARNVLTEYRRYDHLKAEIQIRSILQHTWAEIEHDLGYKSKLEVPRELIRDFFRVAGLLEIADQKFTFLRDKIEKYKDEVSEQIINSPEEVGIDSDSLESFILNDSVVTSLDNRIAQSKKAELYLTKNAIKDSLQEISYFKINNIAQIKKLLQEHQDEILKFASIWLADNEELRKGISIFILCYILAAESDSMSDVISYLSSVGIENKRSWNRIARRVLSTIASINKNKQRTVSY